MYPFLQRSYDLFSSVESLSCVWLFVTPWTAACQASLFITNSWSLLKLMSIESVMSSNHLIHLLPPSLFPSIRIFSNESVLRIRRPKFWNFSFNISPSNEYSGMISFRIDWFDPPAVWGTHKSLLHHHSLKASRTATLKCSLNSHFSQEVRTEVQTVPPNATFFMDLFTSFCLLEGTSRMSSKISVDHDLRLTGRHLQGKYLRYKTVMFATFKIISNAYVSFIS